MCSCRTWFSLDYSRLQPPPAQFSLRKFEIFLLSEWLAGSHLFKLKHVSRRRKLYCYTLQILSFLQFACMKIISLAPCVHHQSSLFTSPQIRVISANSILPLLKRHDCEVIFYFDYLEINETSTQGSDLVTGCV